MELINFIFSGFWEFIGTIILLIIIFEGIAGIFLSIAKCIRSFRKPKKVIDKKI